MLVLNERFWIGVMEFYGPVKFFFTYNKMVSSGIMGETVRDVIMVSKGIAISPKNYDIVTIFLDEYAPISYDKQYFLKLNYNMYRWYFEPPVLTT